MRWVSYRSDIDAQERLALVDGDVLRALRSDETLLGLLRAGGSALSDAADYARADPFEIRPLTGAQILPPIQEPPSIRDFMSFEDHVVTSNAALGLEVDPVWYEQPVFYFSNPAAIVGPHDSVQIAPGSTKWDYEVEVAAIIGTPGSDLDPKEAATHIAGYTILCDWSARDLQVSEMRMNLGPAKGKDTATSLGPMLVTPDELEPYRQGNGWNLTMTAFVNDRPYSSGRLSELYWSFDQMLAYASRGTRLRAGDVIGSGTVGTGCILELSRMYGEEKFPWLREGDEVRIEIEQLGTITSTIQPASTVLPLR